MSLLSRLLPSRTFACAALVVAASLLPAAAPADAAVKRLRPEAVRAEVVRFDLSRIDGRIVAARLVARGRGRRVKASALRTRPVVRIRITRSRREARRTRVRNGRMVRVHARRSWRTARRSALRLKVKVRPPKAQAPTAPDDSEPPPPESSPPPATDEPVAPEDEIVEPVVEPVVAPVVPDAEAPCALEDVGGGVVPGACWRPYSDASPFNRPIPADAKVLENSSRIVSRLTGWGRPNKMAAGDADTADDWWHPTYYSRPSDPTFTLHCTRNWGTCPIEGMAIRVPDAARPAAGGDHHMTIVDPASGWEYDLYDVESKPAGGGTLSFAWGGRTRIDGDGLGSFATAARFGNLAGIIRAPELAAGEIDHALFMVAKCDSGSHVYPAMKSGRSCSVLGEPTADAPPMGARFQLAMSDAEIDALPVPPWKKTILRAMARYGMYVGDTGSTAWAIQAESGSTYTSFGLQDELVSFAQANGVPAYRDDYIFDVADGVDWSRYLRVIDPCTTLGTC